MNILKLINQYFGLEDAVINPIYCKMEQEKVFVYANYSYQRNIIKFNLDDILLSSLVSDSNKRKILRTVSESMFSGINTVHDSYKIN